LLAMCLARNVAVYDRFHLVWATRDGSWPKLAGRGVSPHCTASSECGGWAGSGRSYALVATGPLDSTLTAALLRASYPVEGFHLLGIVRGQTLFETPAGFTGLLSWRRPRGAAGPRCPTAASGSRFELSSARPGAPPPTPAVLSTTRRPIQPRG
jgi:hypothetical protein